MTLKLYGASVTGNTRRVMLVLHEKNVPYQFIPVDLHRGEHKLPQHVANQPFGALPYIDDDGFILFESRAICQYLAEKYADQGTPLIPSGVKERAIYYQAASIEATTFNDVAVKAVVEKFVKPLMGKETDWNMYNQYKSVLEDKFDVYETILSKYQYLGGNEITLADLYHIPLADHILGGSNSDILDKRPNLKRWWGSIGTRPSWSAVKAGPPSS